MKDRTEENSRKKAMYGRGREMTEEGKKKTKCEDDRKDQKIEKRQQEQEGHRGWT